MLGILRVDDIPRLARPNYAAELRHMLLWGVFANLIDGTFSSIVVAKTFQSPLLVPVVWATPLLAHLLSFAWGVFLRGRPKIRTFVILAFGAAASAGSIALTPADVGWGGWLFAGQIALARIFMSGLVNLRTSLWKANYPQSHRARIAGRIQTLNALLMVGMGASVSLLFDRHAEYYRIVYPTIAVVGLLSLIPLRRIRVRGERRELRAFAERFGPENGRSTLQTWVQSFREAATILRRDRDFARYCSAQYLLGSANFMVDPILTLFLTSRLGLGYFYSHLLMEQIPSLLSLFTIAPWAAHFDRVGVLRFRVANSSIWLGSVGLATLALVVNGLLPAEPLLALGILAAGRVCNGIGRGGGTIAWNLGHLHFASGHDADLYMGIHVALTGLRGMIMPFVGTWLYGLIGPASLGLSIVLCSGALIIFHRLAQIAPQPREPEPDSRRQAPDEARTTADAG